MTAHSNKKIIFLMGRQRSGKDTTADYLTKYYGFKKVALADKLKEVAKDLFFMQGKDRDLLLKLGQKMRDIYPDVWLNYLWKTCVDKAPDDARILLSDVRFVNEYNFLTENGAIPIRIESHITKRMKREGFKECYETDPSENYLLSYPAECVLVNDYTLSSLYSQIDVMAEELLEL